MDNAKLKSVLAAIESNINPSDGDILMAGAICSILNWHGAPTAQIMAAAHGTTDYDRATDELHAAEQYASEGNAGFAGDELRHAEYWIEQMQKSARTDAEKNQVRDLIAWHRLLQQKL